MTIDVRTVVLLLILSSVLMTLTLAVGVRTGRGSGFAKWNLGLGLYATGWLLIALRGPLPPLLTMAGADALLLAGLCLQLAALLEFGSVAAPRWLQYAPGPLLFGITLPLMDDYFAFTTAAGISFIVAMVSIAVAAVRLGERGGPARWMLAGAYAVGAAILTVRALMVLGDPVAQTGLFAPSLVHAASFVGIFAVTVTGSTAFLLMLRELAEAEVRHLAMFDPMTELFNRRAFMKLAERERARSRRARVPFAVLMMDLDHFKRVNDEFGHQAGDRVLADFAACARRSVRTEDHLGRYGGEEFCAVLPGASMPKALEIAERIRLAVAERPLGGLPRATTVSIGSAVFGPDAPCTLDAAIGRADEALYRAKREGRDRVVGLEPRIAHAPGPQCEASLIATT